MRLTPGAIRRLELPPGVADKTFFDDDLPGFGVRLREGGSKTFVVQYKIGSKNRRLPLGSVAALGLGQARSIAKDQLAKVRLGEDPFATKLEARNQSGKTFGGKLLEEYLAAKEAELTPRWHRQVTGLLRNYAKPLHGHSIRSINRETVADLVKDVARRHGGGQGNRFRAVLQAYFAWLIGAGKLDNNPVAGSNKPAEEKPRSRVPQDHELAAIWHHAGDDQFGAIVKLLMLTGCRRDEIGALRWSEIDLDNRLITLPPERVKNRREFEIPLTPAVVKILKAQSRQPDRDHVFGYGDGGYQGWTKSKAELDDRLAADGPIEHWTLHDFRRSLSTTMHERLGIPPHIVEACLNHASGHQGGIGGVYNKATYREPKREALTKWAAHLEASMNKRARKRAA